MARTGVDTGRLEDDLSLPIPADTALLRRLGGDLIILGVAGKMGPSLARLARRASNLAGRPRRILGVARFSDPRVRHRLEAWGIDTVQADLLQRHEVEALPDAPNVVFMAGHKFGAAGDPIRTWASNTYMPALVAERFADSKIVAFSSGNVYPFSHVAAQAPGEEAGVGPLGEYAQSVLGRERMFGHFSERYGTQVSVMRLNYAVELRYGVLRDIADRVWQRCPVDLSMGYVNVVWQRDANSVALRLFEHCSSPPFVLNVTGLERLRVRTLAERFGKAFGVEPMFRGREEETALLSDASRCRSLFGGPRVSVDEMIERVAHWVREGGPSLGRPTHYEERAGKF